jgi:hypothetical protein
MSNHFTGLKLGPPLGDPRLDITDLYAFQAPSDPTRTVLILNCNTFAEAGDFHPDAGYRTNIDNDGDAETDVAISFHPTIASFFNTDETKEEYNRTEPVHDRERFLEQFIHVLGHTGNYTREEAIAAIDAERLLPDMMSYNPSQPARYPNGRVFTDHVVAHRLAFISKREIPPDGLTPHTDLLQEFPYLGTPHPVRPKVGPAPT